MTHLKAASTSASSSSSASFFPVRPWASQGPFLGGGDGGEDSRRFDRIHLRRGFHPRIGLRPAVASPRGSDAPAWEAAAAVSPSTQVRTCNDPHFGDSPPTGDMDSDVEDDEEEEEEETDSDEDFKWGQEEEESEEEDDEIEVAANEIGSRGRQRLRSGTEGSGEVVERAREKEHVAVEWAAAHGATGKFHRRGVTPLIYVLGKSKQLRKVR